MKYECMYRECSKEWGFKPYEVTLRRHLMRNHYDIVVSLNSAELDHLVRAFELSIDRQHKDLM